MQAFKTQPCTGRGTRPACPQGANAPHQQIGNLTTYSATVGFGEIASANVVGYQANAVPTGYPMITPCFENVDGTDYAIDNFLLNGVADCDATVQVVNSDGTWGANGAWLNEAEYDGTFADATSSTGGWTQTVPEPTSGLLMLFGLGALARRRRRA